MQQEKQIEIQPEGMQLDSQSTAAIDTAFTAKAGNTLIPNFGSVEGAGSSVYGICLDLPPLEKLLEWREGIAASKAGTKAEVLLVCGGESRTCSFEELVAFMKGKQY